MPDTELKTSHIKDKVTKVVQCSDLMKCSNYLGIKIKSTVTILWREV